MASTHFTVDIAGQRYSGSWHLASGTIHVVSDYGSKFASVRRDRPAQVAARLLREIVMDGDL